MNCKKNIILLVLGLFMAVPASLHAQRKVTNIDFDWYFHLGDVEEGQNADYSSWRLLDVPHDWSIEGEYREDNPGKGSYAFLPTGIGWYKKEIEWEPGMEPKSLAIEFDGIFMNSSVWVNGEFAGYRPNGYIGIYYVITDKMKPGKNIITVKVDNTRQPAARWYSGSGIYRHVNLIETGLVRVERYGTRVTTPEVSESSATVRVETTLRNDTRYEVPVTVNSIVTDASGNEVARTDGECGVRSYPASEKNSVVTGELTISSPELWSPDTPNMYYLTTEVIVDGKISDTYRTPFGVRKTEFIPGKGFFLNGKPTKFKGVCLHQNTSPYGTAMPDDVQYRRLVQLKEMGCNAVRTSHYAYAPEFYDMCDALGLMVMDELFDGWFHWSGYNKASNDYGVYFLEWWERDLADFILRDRNHPSIMMWSLGNEVWGWERHQYLQYSIHKMFHDLDGTRPTTQAWALGTHLDIAGFNANGEAGGDLANFHKDQPRKLAVGTEIPHTRQTRGVYRTIGAYNAWINPERYNENDTKRLFPVTSYTDQEVFPEFDKRYASSYDNQTRKISIREQWKQTRDNDFFTGEFRWTAFDYLGEAWGWPARTNNYGIVDLAGFPKDGYFLYRSLWSEKPMVHILPHWTWPGKEGVEIPVVVYTNGDSAELIVNGKSLGVKQMDPDVLELSWLVPYKAGSVTAVAYKDGREIARATHATAGKPATVKLTADRDEIRANRRDVVRVEVDILDSRGRFVPNASNALEFEVTGPYKLIGVENGDILDMSPNKAMKSKAFMGKALLVLQATGDPGTLRVKATSKGLKTGNATVVVK